MKHKKKLIEVALPLIAINAASVREKSISHGHPSTLHLWWARRPLAAARAVIFAQMVDDPAAHPDIFKTEKAQEKERQRLFRIIEQLVQWENTTNEKVIQQARNEIWQSWRYACAENADHPRAKELFDRNKLPAFHDPFAGGGSLPLEAQRLGLESYASDLNPVAVLICKAMIEIPPRFADRPPVNPTAQNGKHLVAQGWSRAQGLAEDVGYYGQWMRDEAEKRIGHLYPNVEVTAAVARDRPDLKPYVGRSLKVIGWLWARTVRSPNPAFSDIQVPLASTFVLSTKPGHEAYVQPIIEKGGYRFAVRLGKPTIGGIARSGTKMERANFACVMSGAPISGDYIKAEARSGHMKTRLMATVVEGQRTRLYLPPTAEMEEIANSPKPSWIPDVDISGSTQYLGIKPYGMERFSELFTDRQLVALGTLSDLVSPARKKVLSDAQQAGLRDGNSRFDAGPDGASAYADAVAIYLALGVSRQVNRSSTLCFWDTLGEKIQQVFARQALSMTWDFVEGNPFSKSSGNFVGQLGYLTNALRSFPAAGGGRAAQLDATAQDLSKDKIVSTDPPYFDNVPYADLSDFFYVWLRHSLKALLPDLFATVAVPKADELVAFAYRHKDKQSAEAFFMEGMGRAVRRLAEQVHPAFPVTVYYAFRQAETQSDGGTSSTGWETFLDAVIRNGFCITGTWPIRTEYTSNLKTNRNALASSIVLVCRKADPDAATASRRDFIDALKAALPPALDLLQAGNIAPVDLQQAIIGPGMAVYTRYTKVLDAEGKSLPVRAALALINQILDEALAQQEGDFDPDSRWALVWFEQHGFAEGEYGQAEQLSKSKNTSVAGMVDAGFLRSGRAKVRLLRPSELPAEWDPATDTRLSAWEVVHHLVRALESGSEGAAAALVAKLGTKAESARQLAYRLYTISERKKRAAEAMSYNALVQSWPEITRLARSGIQKVTSQADMFAEVSE